MSVESDTRLVAVRLPPGEKLAAALREIWRDGDAVMPLDPGLPPAAVGRALETARPSTLIDESGRRELHEPLPVATDLAAVVTTSGTTGAPKAVELSRAALRAAATAANTRLGAQAGDRWLCCVPLWRIAGLAILERSRVLGTEAEVHPGFDAARVGRGSDANFVSLVPTMLHRLLDAGVDVARFDAILLGGGPLPTELIARAERAGARVVRSYGMTETGGGVVYDGVELDGVLVEVDDRSDVSIGGPTVMKGYRGDPARTAAVLNAGRVRTGDYGRRTDHGRLEILGRRAPTIFSGGEKIDAALVADVLQSHAGVARAYVVGRPDPEWGERVVAFIEPSDREAPPTLEELRAWVGQRLPRYMAPKEVSVA